MRSFLKVFIVFIIFSTLGNKTIAQDYQPYKLEKIISLSGNGGYDYIAIDHKNSHLFVTHGSKVHIIDLKSEKPIATIEGMQGVHGVAIVNEVNKGFITDGLANAVIVFDLNNFNKVGTIPLSGKKCDAIIYDPKSKYVFAFNGYSSNASVIDINMLKEIKVIDLGGAPEFAVSNGKGMIYNNLEDKSSLAVIDTKSLSVIHTYPLKPCGGPTGIDLDKKHNRLFTVCRENKGMSVLDPQTGRVIITIPIGAGVDAIEYDEKEELIFVSNGDGTATIIKQVSADEYKVIQTLSTENRAKTMAYDPATHKIYLSVPQFVANTRDIIPESFHVLVYKKAK